MIRSDMIIDEVQRALNEDIGTGDVTANLIPAELQMTAEIISREPMLLCGQPWVNAVFASIDPTIQVTWMVKEGEFLEEPTALCRVYGSARHILTAERTALNFLQVLSGTATETYRYVEKLKAYPTCLLDTRKTLPGLRYAQKYAVKIAGGTNHRFGLFDAYLIKENHIAACGSIREAVLKAKSLHQDLLIEVEVENLHELKEALAVSPGRILLDNFSVETLKEAVKINTPKICPLEASGGITLNTIEMIAQTGVDYISTGSITKSLHAIDLSLLIINT